MSAAVELRPPTSVGGSWYHTPKDTPEPSKVVTTLQPTGREGMVHWVVAHNVANATRFLFVFDGTDATGTLIAGPFAVAAGADVSADIRYGRPLTNGLFVAFSTGDAAFAVTGGNDAFFDVGWHEMPNG